MRSADAYGADGPANWRDAIAVVTSGGAAKAGVIVVLDGWIHAARFVHRAGIRTSALFDPHQPARSAG
jgi:L-asparaginase